MPGPSSVRLGRVSDFDGRRGWGTVTDAAGIAFEFHATAIADGTRAIDPDAVVAFVVVPGHRGRWEARAINRTT